MIKNLLVAMTSLLAILMLSARNGGIAVLLIGTAVVTALYAPNNYHHVLGKQLDFLAGRLTQALAGLTPCIILISLAGRADVRHTAYFSGAFALSLLPLALPLALRGHWAASGDKLSQHHAIKILRSTLTANAAAFTLVLFSLIGLYWLHIAPVISLPQLLAAALIIVPPLAALHYDQAHNRLIQVTARNLHAHALSLKSLKTYLGYGLPAASFAYAAYLLTFTWNHLNPQYIDTALPLHRRATTAVFMTLVLCSFTAILYERVDHHDKFFVPYLTHNKKLLQAFAVSLLILATIIYTPGVQNLFQMSPLSLLDWGTALLLSAAYGGWRLLQRHTRLHTRRALLQLHQETQN